VWRYRFEPVEGGTRVTESYEVEWIPAWARIIDVPSNRHRQLQQGMCHTLEQLKNAAEATAPSSSIVMPGDKSSSRFSTGYRRPRIVGWP
jgi:hypothetical protein